MPALDLTRLPLPKVAPPGCRSCGSKLTDVRPYRADNPHSRLVLVHCLAKCPRCSAKHIGARALVPAFASLRFLRQSFELYQEQDAAALRIVLEFLTLGEEGSPIDFDTMSGSPTLVVWFENTLADRQRAGKGTPASGLKTDAGHPTEGVVAFEGRELPGHPGVWTAAKVTFDSADGLQLQLERWRQHARLHGTVAWFRDWRDDATQVLWDNGQLGPGNQAIKTHPSHH